MKTTLSGKKSNAICLADGSPWSTKDFLGRMPERPSLVLRLIKNLYLIPTSLAVDGPNEEIFGHRAGAIICTTGLEPVLVVKTKDFFDTPEEAIGAMRAVLRAVRKMPALRLDTIDMPDLMNLTAYLKPEELKV